MQFSIANMPFEVITELQELHIEQLHALYQHEWWTKGRSLELTRQCVQGSQVCFGLLDDRGNLVGFTRVISDYTFKALVLDVIVAKHLRGLGLGDHLVGLVGSHERLRAVKHFELYCLPELVPFYSRFGFSEKVGEIRFMRRVTAGA
jgi:GNAT superfamily N-acetyltransferase